jgi:hypothetical protein
MAAPFMVLDQAVKPFSIFLAALLATFQVNLRCDPACAYCDLPLNVGRYVE